MGNIFGTKNRIYLGLITAFLLHNHRNIFSKVIYMSKRVQLKIKEKHLDSFKYTNRDDFLLLMNSTIGSCSYDSTNHTVNFIAYIESTDKYIIYSLKQEKYHTTCNTIFSLRADTLAKYYKQNDFKLFKKAYLGKIEAYIKTKPSDQTRIS